MANTAEENGRFTDMTHVTPKKVPHVHAYNAKPCSCCSLPLLSTLDVYHFCGESCCCVQHSNIDNADLQATMYPNAYGANCESGSTQPYGMPNFGSLAKDPLLPQRCQDPTQMQVSNLIACPLP